MSPPASIDVPPVPVVNGAKLAKVRDTKTVPDIQPFLDDHKNGILNSNKTSELKLGASPIAICGMAMRLPGGIRDADSFWDVLVNGKDTRGPIPADRYNATAYRNIMGKNGAIKTQHGYFLKEDLSVLDTSFFTMSKTELERVDPQQRQLLEVTREALDNAGETGYRGKPIGCYVGTFGEDWLQISSKETQHQGGYVLTGHGDLMLANRVSFEYNLTGPSMVIKTGCSASLVGLHEACRALQSGDCVGAIVAGTNLIMGPSTTAAMTKEGILSPEGSCKTFDAAADGYARGEAVTAVYIKPLADAVRDGNPIRAVIRGTGTNSDGRSEGLMTPNSKSHEALMRRVYKETGLKPEETAMVECHGTGTPTGDPLETTAVGEVFGSKGVYIGSVKPNMGHSEGASGITSLIKAVLSLENVVIPPNIKFSHPNPKIPFAEKNLMVPVKPTQWPGDRAKRISVNSFGIGGSNAHIILDAPAEHVNENKRNNNVLNKDLPCQLGFLSANTQESLRQYTSSIQGYASLHPGSVPDLAYTLALHREHLVQRSFIIFDKNGGILDTSSPVKAPTRAPDIVMVFSGQGAQWPTMGKELIHSDQAFGGAIREMDGILKSLTHPPTWSLAEELDQPDNANIHQAELSQPLCTAVQLAMVHSLQHRGVQFTAVIGHSSGELAAAYACGALSMAEALISAYYRGFVTKEQTRAGGMAAVSLPAAEVLEYLIPGVTIACDNSPSSVTISGDIVPLERVMDTIRTEEPDALVRRLKVNMAYHSDHMAALGARYHELLDTESKRLNLQREDPQIPFLSTVHKAVISSGAELGPEYWVKNLTSPVRFHPSVKDLLQKKPSNSNILFLEIGPHSTLSGPLRQICSDSGSDCRYIATMNRGKDSVTSFLTALGQLYQNNVQLDLKKVVPSGSALHDLPSYAWDYSNGSFWYEPRVSREWRMRQFGHHQLLGLRVVESPTMEPVWRNVLSLDDEPWLADHRIKTDIVFPFAGYVSMAGEAVRQATGGGRRGYRVRHAVTHTAMVLQDSQSIEIITTLKPVKLGDSTDSAWFSFSIYSNSTGSTWIKNCDGQVQQFNEDLGSPSDAVNEAKNLPRKIHSARWYQAMADTGIVYGTEFQALSNIASATGKNLASARIDCPTTYSPDAFVVHPTMLDACLQLLMVALARGVGRNFRDLCMPTTIEDLVVRDGAAEMDAVASSQGHQDLAVDCLVDGVPAVQLRGLRLASVEDVDDNEGKGAEDHAAARLEWRPDFDLADHATLFDPPRSIPEETVMQEEMTLLCILESAERLQTLEPCQPHFEKFRDWLTLEIHRAKDGTYPILENSEKLLQLPSSARHDRIMFLHEKLVGMPTKGPVAEGIKRIYDHAEELFTGKQDTLDILMRGDCLKEIYNGVSFGKGAFFQQLSHTRPMLRILEVGAGTGGTTDMILKALVRPDGHPPYSVYTFTDVSAGFFPQARERFSYAPNMDYRVFDISCSPFEQGFEPSSFDVIVAGNVVHATPSLNITLSNLQPLLRPGGHLVLTELCAEARTPNYIFGHFSGWWLGEADNRPYEPYVPVSRWDEELKRAGFTGVDTAVRDAEEPLHYCAAIVSRRVEPEEPSIAYLPLTVLCANPNHAITKRVVGFLQSTGKSVSLCRLGESFPPSDGDVISLLDIEDHFFANLTPDQLEAFQTILRSHHSGSILWVTRPAQLKCKDPRSAQSIGVARSIRSESGIPFYTLEIDETEPQFETILQRVWDKIVRTADDGFLAPDREYVVDNGVVHLGRYQSFAAKNELSLKSVFASEEASPILKLEVAKPGLLDTLRWARESQVSHLGKDEVEVEARAIGLNFKDILYATGTLRGDPIGTVPLGLEMAGTVKAIGANVKNLSVGDRVVALPPKACFRTAITMPSVLVQKIPDELSWEDAATMPICYATAIESLLNTGRLITGQSVLIHSACGGVGLAAIQIATMVGAEIYATVGSEEKVDYLVQNFNIPQSHIFHSRDTSFVADLMRHTNNCGVDIVLNSLSGDLLRASWDCVAEFGKMIELGKRDIVDFGSLPMNNFMQSRSYCCVDLTHLVQKRSKHAAGILKQCINFYRQGDIKPIHPRAIFQAANVQDAFRHVQNGDHIGKAVVSMPQDQSSLPSTIQQQLPLHLDANATYLITGGLGGLGKPIASWLVEVGARSLVFLSPRAGTLEEDRQFFRELEDSGCTVNAFAGKVELVDDLNQAIALAPSPIKGVIHLAMVLRDSPVANMAHSDWIAANSPKVTGAWNLHKALETQPLDFLVLASSLVTIVEQPGQGNYSAANTFLEAFCQYRHLMNLPASVLNICPIENIGFVAENPFARKNLKAQGLYFLGEEELLDFLDLAIRQSHPSSATASSSRSAPWKNESQLVMGLRSEQDLNHPDTRTNWRRDRRMGFYHNSKEETKEGNQGGSNEFQTFLATAREDPEILNEARNVEYLSKEIGRKVFSFMLRDEADLDTSLTLKQIGLDSLMAIELRRWWKQAMGLEISVLEIMATGSIEALGAVAAQSLKAKLSQS